MTAGIYGVELNFPVPANVTPNLFGDRFDDATSHLGEGEHVVTLDAVLRDGDMFVLVGVGVGESVDPKNRVFETLDNVVYPALLRAGVERENINIISSADSE